MDIKYFDTTTPESMKKAIRFESQNPDYKLINGRLDLTWMFEKKEDQRLLEVDSEMKIKGQPQ